MSGHRAVADLAGDAYIPSGGAGLGRPAIITGDGAPDNTTDIGMVYIRMDGSNGNEVLYTWDNTAAQWDAMTA